MSDKILEELDKIWNDEKETKKVSNYLYGAYNRLEKDFLTVLEYVPLRETHLSVSSPRFADFVLRTSPLINKVFRVLSFHQGLFEILKWQTNPSNKNGMSEDDLTTIKELLLKLHKLKKKNRDSISNYHEWVSSGLFYKLFNVTEDEIVQTRLKTEVIETEMDITPFKSEVWDNWVENRRRIEHRNQTEASIKCVLQGLAITAKLLELNANVRHMGGDWFESNLFDLSSSIVWVTRTRQFTNFL